jgi:hypothetical protein
MKQLFLALLLIALGFTGHASAAWQRNYANMIVGWNVYHLSVIDLGAGQSYRYRGWFMGWAYQDSNRNIPGYTKSDAIFYARSTDNLTWQVYKGSGQWDSTGNTNLWRPVIQPRNLYYDQWHNGDPSVVYVSDFPGGARYYMAYSSTGFDADGKADGTSGDVDKDFYCVMGAWSSDGINWTKSAGPWLAYGPDYGVVEFTPAATYRGSFHRPSLVLERSGTSWSWHLFFDYWAGSDNGGTGMGHALSNQIDPVASWSAFSITHSLDAPVIKGWPNPEVAKVGNLWYTASDPPGYPGGGNQWTTRQLRWAYSPNPASDYAKVEFEAPDSGEVDNQVPSLRVSGNTLYMTYCNQRGGNPFDWRNKQIRMMWRDMSVDDFYRRVCQEWTIAGTRSQDMDALCYADGFYESVTESVYANQSYGEMQYKLWSTGRRDLWFGTRAFHSGNNEGDNFDFAWSTDQTNWNYMLTVTKTSDDGQFQWFQLPQYTAGWIYIRAIDTDRTLGNTQADTLWIDDIRFGEYN